MGKKNIYRKLSILVFVILLFSLILGGCGSKEAGGKKETIYLTFASGSVGGAYYPLGGGIADIVSELEGFNVHQKPLELL